MKPKIAIIVLSLNRWDVSKRFLDFLVQNTNPDLYSLYWVDNGSADETPKHLRSFVESHPELSFSLDLRDKNFGVIGGRNLGFKWFSEDPTGKTCTHLLFIDNDQYCKKGWLEHHLAVLNRGYDLVGVEAWQLNRALFPIHRCTKLNEWFSYVGCGGMLMSRKVAEKLDRFDERFNPSYFEDPDYNFRSIDAGFRIGWNFTARIVHLPHQTLSCEKDRTEHFIRSFKRFKEKWKGKNPPMMMQQRLLEFDISA